MFFLYHSRRLFALGWPLRRFQAPQRLGRPSAPPPLVPMQPGNRRYPHWAREPHGGNPGGQDKGEMEGGEHKHTRATATGQRGCSPDAPHPRFCRPLAGDLSQLKRQHKTGLIGPFPFLLPIFPAAAPPPGSSHPCLYYRISWEASPSSAQRWGSTRSWDGGRRREKNVSPTPCQKKDAKE